MKRKFQVAAGLLFWGLSVAIICASLSLQGSPAVSEQVSLTRYFSGPLMEIEVRDPGGMLKKGDPVFFQDTDGSWRQIAHVDRGHRNETDETVRLAWYDDASLADRCTLRRYRNTGRLDEMVATMLSPAKRERIERRLADAMAAHGEELSAALVPLVQRSIRESLPVIEEEFRAATERHRDEIDQMAERFNDEVVSQRLIPLARREILPIVRRHGEPLADDIGHELWDRASLWRFGWRAIYDKTPLPQRDLLEEEWDRFVQREAVPVFEARMEDIVEAIQRVVTDVAANGAVRTELVTVADEFAADPATRRLVKTILRESLVDNRRLREVWTGVWNSDEAKRALNLAGDRLEPVVRGIGDDLFGTRQSGIDPDFARVLRSQILGKDRQWIVATVFEPVDPNAGDPPTVVRASEPMPYPIIYLADQIDEDPGGGGAAE
jgi:hypothetical protein